jgi:hypothetical protein
LGKPISIGFTNGCCDWSSRSAERPSQNCRAKYAAFTTVGALRVPVSFLMPSEVLSGLSVNALPASWQVAQLTSPVELKRLSLNSVLPRAIFSGVIGLLAGTGNGGRPSGAEKARATGSPAAANNAQSNVG